jgi:predicted esterase
MIKSRVLLVAALAAAFSAIVSAADAPAKAGGGVSIDDAKLEPGKEIKIADSKTGGDGYWTLYLPSDYNAARKWPVIYCFHPAKSDPSAWPFKDLTDGKGYIIVGMEYLDRGNTYTDPEKDLANLRRIHEQLAQHLKLDEKLKFIGGMSQGGWRSNRFYEISLDMWAGHVILGAGRDSDLPGHDAKYPKQQFTGKAIFIGAGEQDGNLPAAQHAEKYYKERGASVVLEVFPKLGHAVDTSNKALKQWLRDHGPLLAVKSNLAAAHAAEKSGKLGQAYALYQMIAQDASAAGEAPAARAAAELIVASADKALADAEAAITARKYLDAIKGLQAAESTFGGCDRAEKIKSRLTALQNDPTIQSEIAQAEIDAAADAAENRALTAEKSKDFKRAIATYDAYLASYPKSHRIAEIRRHLATLKADKTIQSGIASKQVDSDCKSWLSLARTYIQNGSSDHAKVYFQKVIDNYPGTEYARTAAKELAELK